MYQSRITSSSSSSSRRVSSNVSSSTAGAPRLIGTTSLLDFPQQIGDLRTIGHSNRTSAGMIFPSQFDILRPIENPAWVTGGHFMTTGKNLTNGGFMTSTGSVASSSRRQRFEWQPGHDGVLRRVCLEDVSEASGNLSPPLLEKALPPSVMSTAPSTPSGSLTFAPLTRFEAVQPLKTMPTFFPISSPTDSVAAKDECSIDGEEEQDADILRAARVRAAGKSIMKSKRNQETKVSVETEKNEMEKELGRLRAESARTASLEGQMQQLMEQLESMKVRQNPEAIRKEMEAEMGRLREEELKKRRSLELELTRIREQGLTVEISGEKQQELEQLQLQQKVLSQTMKVEEEASKIVDQGDKFLAIDHPFRSIMLQIHNMKQFSATALQTVQAQQSCTVTASLGSSSLSVDGAIKSDMVDWEELLMFPYMNERVLRIVTKTKAGMLGGVKIEMEDFLKNCDMCGSHNIPLTDAHNRPVGTLSVTLHLSTEHVSKSVVAIKPQPVTPQEEEKLNQNRVLRTRMSAIVSPFRSIKAFISSDAKLPESTEELSCRMILGYLVMNSSVPLSKDGGAEDWVLEFGLPFQGERELAIEVFSVASPSTILGRATLDIDTVLMSRVENHAASLVLKLGDAVVGSLPVGVEFSRDLIAPYVSKKSSASTVSSSQVISSPTAPFMHQMPSALELLSNMRSMHAPIGGDAGMVAATPLLRMGSFFTDTGLGLLPIMPMEEQGMLMLDPMRALETSKTIIPKVADCKVEVHSVRDLIVEPGVQLAPIVKIVLGVHHGETRNPMVIPESSGARWKTVDGCFVFKVNVEKMAAQNSPSMMFIDIVNNGQHISYAELSALPILTATTGRFSGDIQLTQMKNGQSSRCGVDFQYVAAAENYHVKEELGSVLRPYDDDGGVDDGRHCYLHQLISLRGAVLHMALQQNRLISVAAAKLPSDISHWHFSLTF